MRPHKLSCYFVDCSGDGEGIAVVAYTAKAAKKFVWDAGECGCDWIEVKVRLLPGVDISDLAEGHMLTMEEGAKRGAYYGDCSLCGCVDCGSCSWGDEK